MIYIKRFNFCYIRVPKNGSSTTMDFLYNNVCDPKEDVVSRAYEWDDDMYEKVYHLNCPILPHSHVDASYVIDNGIVPKAAKFRGIVRNPYERQLSLYFYGIRDMRYGLVTPSIDDFRSRVVDGVFQDKPQQMQSQTSFLKYNGEMIGEFWLLDRLEDHLNEFCEEYRIQVKRPKKDLNKSPGSKKELVDIFYTKEMKQMVREVYADDFATYETLKDFYGVI